MRIVAHLRPILSARIPAGSAPAKAPIAIKLPTQDSEKMQENNFVNFCIFEILSNMLCSRYQSCINNYSIVRVEEVGREGQDNVC
jgi:hypothetical protein